MSKRGRNRWAATKAAAPAVQASVGAGSGYSFTSSAGLYPASQETTLRGWRPDLTRDVWQMIPQARHRSLVSDGRYIYGGSGAVSGAVRKRADYAVGWAWNPVYKGNDERFRAIAVPIMERWLNLCDVRGPSFDFRMGLRIASIAMDRDGDTFAVLTRTPDGGPRIQWLEAHRIGTPGFGYSDNIVPAVEGTEGYAGKVVLSGIIYDEQMAPIGYNRLTPSPDGFGYVDRWDIIPAASVVHFMDPSWTSQARGIPSICNAVLDWYDIGETREAEKIGTKARSAIAIVEKNETGRREVAREAVGLAGVQPGRGGLQTQMLERGLIRYIKSSGEISAFESNKPGDAWQNFMDYVTRGAFLGMDLPYEFAWDSSKLGGANIRAVVGQVQRSVENRQAVMYQAARLMLLHAVGTYMRRGDIPFSADWFKWEFQMPAKYSVDVGRDSQNRREDFSVGLRSATDILGEDGITIREHLEQRAKDYLEAKRISDEMEVPLEWILNPSGAAPSANQPAAQIQVDDSENGNQPGRGARQEPEDTETE